MSSSDIQNQVAIANAHAGRDNRRDQILDDILMELKAVNERLDKIGNCLLVVQNRCR